MHSNTYDHLPLPKGNTAYAQAKRAEYVDRDIQAAKLLYRQAIALGDRTESALKDLASILHQEGSTAEACLLLAKYQHCFTDQKKFQNLYRNLQDKMVPTGKSLNRTVKIFPLTEYDTAAYVRSLFRDSSRILNIEISTNCRDRFALLQFSSHSAARKTIASFHKWNHKHSFEWININGESAGEVWDYKKKNRKPVIALETPPRSSSADPETAELLLGKDLMAEISSDSSLNVAAKPFVPM